MDHHIENAKLTLKKNGKSFYWAGKFLPKQDINRAAELYSFCRLLDDIADNGQYSSLKILEDIRFNIKKKTWFAMKSSGSYSLIGCTVAPAFEFSDLELAPKNWKPSKFDQQL